MSRLHASWNNGGTNTASTGLIFPQDGIIVGVSWHVLFSVFAAGVKGQGALLPATSAAIPFFTTTGIIPTPVISTCFWGLQFQWTAGQDQAFVNFYDPIPPGYKVVRGQTLYLAINNVGTGGTTSYVEIDIDIVDR
jgi:hypothetical protein